MLCGSQQELTQSTTIHVIIVSITDEFLLLLEKKKIVSYWNNQVRTESIMCFSLTLKNGDKK